MELCLRRRRRWRIEMEEDRPERRRCLSKVLSLAVAKGKWADAGINGDEELVSDDEEEDIDEDPNSHVIKLSEAEKRRLRKPWRQSRAIAAVTLYWRAGPFAKRQPQSPSAGESTDSRNASRRLPERRAAGTPSHKHRRCHQIADRRRRRDRRSLNTA
nr:hypothetical protein Iba_chr04bCG11720 [Ipomoea batatas]